MKVVVKIFGVTDASIIYVWCRKHKTPLISDTFERFGGFVNDLHRSVAKKHLKVVYRFSFCLSSLINLPYITRNGNQFLSCVCADYLLLLKE